MTQATTRKRGMTNIKKSTPTTATKDENIIEMAPSERRGTTYWSIGTNNKSRKKERREKYNPI